jgi:hypothetical protein
VSASNSGRAAPRGDSPGALGGLDDLSRLPPPVPAPPSSLLEAELARLTPISSRRPLRQLGLLVGLSLIYGGGVLTMLTIRHDLRELPMGWLIGAGLAWLIGFVAPVYLATVPGPGAVIPRWRLAGIASVVGAIGFMGLGLALHPAGPSSVVLGWDRIARGYACFEWGLATALVPVVIGAIFLRGALPVGSRWVAAALGAGGGSLGGLMLHLHCPIVDGVHVSLVHGSVVGGAALLAAAMVPRATHVR